MRTSDSRPRRLAPARAPGARALPRRVLLATDLSVRCDRALDRAAALTSAWGAQLVALHALADDGRGLPPYRPVPSWRRPPDRTQWAVRQLQRAIGDLGVAGAAVRVERGRPDEVIARVAEAEGAELIVAGVPGSERGRPLVPGGTVDRVLRQTTIPVLIVKDRFRSPYRGIVVATDFSASSRAAIEAAMALFPGRALTAFHACEPHTAAIAANPVRHEEQCRQAALREWTGFAAGLRSAAGQRPVLRFLVEYGRPVPLLQEYVNAHEVDLVVVGMQARGALMNMLVGNVAGRMLAGLPCDLLVVREPCTERRAP